MTRYGKIRLYLQKYRKRLDGSTAMCRFELVEVVEQFSAGGFYFNLHRSRDGKKWGVTESTTGYSVSIKPGNEVKKGEIDGYLHTTREGAMSQARRNVEKALKEGTLQSAIYASRVKHQPNTPLHVELKKYGLWK